MGASSSVQIFESFTTSLQWVLINKCSVIGVSHIVDDFIFFGPQESNDCMANLRTFLALCNNIGIPIKHDKTVLPTTSCQVHGIEIDTTEMVARLPKDKILNLQSLLHSYKCRKKVKLVDLQSLIGSLNFACKVIKPGRCFLRRLYDLTCGIKNAHHFIKLTSEVRADLALWSTFIDQYNGVTLLTNDRYMFQLNAPAY